MPNTNRPHIDDLIDAVRAEAIPMRWPSFANTTVTNATAATPTQTFAQRAGGARLEELAAQVEAARLAAVEADRKALAARRRRRFKEKIALQLNCGHGRRDRVGESCHDPRNVAARRLVKHGWKMQGTLGGFQHHVIRKGGTAEQGSQAYLRTLPYPHLLSTSDRNRLVGLTGIPHIRIGTEPGLGDIGAIYEWVCFTGTVLSPTSGGAMHSTGRKGVEEHRKLGHYIDEVAKTIVPVSEEEWKKWPMTKSIQVRGYKRFDAMEVVQTPWMTSPSASRYGAVLSPVKKLSFNRDKLETCIGDYHSASRRGHIKLDLPNSSTFTFGSEIEIMPAGDTHREAAAAEILQDLGAVLDIERDGSVAAGFEIVTGFGSFNALDEAVRKLYAEFLSSRHRAYNASSATGLHFHVGRAAGIDYGHISRMWTFEGMYPQLMDMLVGRSANRYCVRSVYTKETMDVQAQHYGVEHVLSRAANEATPRATRYTSFNATQWNNSDGTRFEWRSCKSTTSYASWRGRLELMQVMLDWATKGDLFKTKIPTVDDFLLRIMDSPREQTVGLRRVLKSSHGQTVLNNLGATVSVVYNGRREYAALNV